MRIRTVWSAHFVRFLERLSGRYMYTNFHENLNLKEIEIVVSFSTIPLVCLSVFSFGAIGRSLLFNCSISWLM